MNLLLTADQNYFVYMYVLIQSVCYNSSASEITFYIACINVDQKDKDELKFYFEKIYKHINIVFIAVPRHRNYSENLRVSKIKSEIVYAKILCLDILPDEVEKILYLDVDTIVNGDLKSLYEADISGFALAACGGIGFCGAAEYDTNKKLKGQFFNSGVVLFNIKKIRQESFNLSEIIDQNKNYYYDQGILNYLFCEKAKYVPTELFNFRFAVFEHTETYNYQDAVVIHYSNVRTPYKPWDLFFSENEIREFNCSSFRISSKLNQLFSLWWKYVDMLQNDIKKRLKEEAYIKTKFYKRNLEESFIALNKRINNAEKELNNNGTKMKHCEKTAWKLKLSQKWISKNRIPRISLALLGSCFSRVCMMGNPFFVDNYKDYVDLKYILYHSSYLSLLSEKIEINTEGISKNRIPRISLALLGSCFSRVCMMGNPFFVDNYKDYVDLKYILYHSSYLSLLSEKIEINTEGIRTKNVSNQRSFETWADIEFKKTFFDDIKKIHPDYIIIDNFADANYDVVQTQEGQFFTLNYFIKDTDLPDQFGEKTILKLDSEIKLTLLKESIELFFHKLKEIIPEERIILVKGRMSEYRRFNGSIIKWNNYADIQKKNKIWDYVDSLVQNECRNIKIIDMTHTNYVSSDRFPLGNSPSHYEEQYYQELFEKYIDTFLENIE